MWKIDGPLTCAECDSLIRSWDDWGGTCIICHEVFCKHHIVGRDGVDTCVACTEIRRRREDDGPISQDDADRVARLLIHDVVETIGPGHEAEVQESVARIRLFANAPTDFEQRVVDDVQQLMHDTFVDTSWPACPEHPHHPLWYTDGSWTCDKSGRRVAPLGGLRRSVV